VSYSRKLDSVSRKILEAKQTMLDNRGERRPKPEWLEIDRVREAKQARDTSNGQ
jgi:hypothetical protein